MEDLLTTMRTMETTRGSLGPWLFRGLLLIGAGLMLVSWYAAWWSAQLSVIVVPDPMVMHPWGVEVMDVVASAVDRSLYEMPAFFAPLMWLYLVACMAALLASLFVDRTIALGSFKVSLPQALIAVVGLSYMAIVGGAFAVALVRSGFAGVNFIGSTLVYNPLTGNETKITGALKPGYWLAVAVGPLLIALALLRNIISGSART